MLGRGSTAPALHTPPHRQGSHDTPTDRRTCEEHPGAGTTQESQTQHSSASLPVEQPGDMIDVDIRQLARFERVGGKEAVLLLLLNSGIRQQ